ncbi:hypothetical protein LPJ61_003895 [Coemansia biformis]|uniref:Phosducin domain-containing protein n=1 Tax=Coemansia biformis TaxID=1286918 RepID=A0A9W8CVV4_9FUNG|nr:hypothetical protein LPJ61_003895 [Coemansia biformis]
MADIEQRMLAQSGAAAGNDEDRSERLRAVANGDAREAETSGNGAEHAPPAGPHMAHSGPQTGVKGVLADYRHSRRERQRLCEQAAAAERAARAAGSGRGTQACSARTLSTKEEARTDSDSEIDRILDSDGDDSERIFDEYKARRMAELGRAAAQAGVGVLRDATPDEYVEIVDQRAADGAYIAVALVDGGRASRRLGEYVGTEAAHYPQTVFLRVQAEQCGFTDAAVIPILLVYRHGELVHNLVRVVDKFSDPLHFERRDVAKLLDCILCS